MEMTASLYCPHREKIVLTRMTHDTQRNEGEYYKLTLKGHLFARIFIGHHYVMKALKNGG